MPHLAQSLRLAGLGLGLHSLLWAQLTLAAPKPASPANAAAPGQARSRVVYDNYILGPGDTLQIELLDIPELSGTFSIGPDGTLYLPRLRALYVEGLTVEELRYFLAGQFKAFVRNPEVFIQPVSYRPIRVYVGGEVRRPGFYTLTSQQTFQVSPSQQEQSIPPITTRTTITTDNQSAINAQATSALAPLGIQTSRNSWPTVFDAIQSAQGVTAFSDLAKVEVTRRQPLSSGGGKIRTSLDFVRLITEGDETQNIRLFDGDVVAISKSPVVLRDQLLKAGQTNLSPQYLEAFVSGRVKRPGPVVIPQGASLNQALIAAGGVQLLRGKVEFVRFTREGEVDRRLFSYQANAASGSPSNPILMSGDIINVQDSIISATTGVLNELTGPFVGVYSVYSLFR